MKMFDLLLLLFPKAFRAEYGGEIRAALAFEKKRVDSSLGLFQLYLNTFVDLITNAARTHADLLAQDLKHSYRAFTRAPGFSLGVITITALGIGANTTVFSVADLVLLRPLPYAEPDRLVKLWEHTPSYSRMEASPPNYRDWRDQLESFDVVAGYTGFSANLIGEMDPERVTGAMVVPELLPTLGIRPLIGRTFGPDEAEQGAPGTVLLSYSLWQNLFGGRDEVIGRQVRLDEDIVTVIGVMPQTFAFPNRETDLWRASLFNNVADDQDRDNNYINVLARLAPGVSVEQARAECDLLATALENEYPDNNAETRINVVELRDQVPTQTRALLLALFAASAAVLLIACANLACLLMARAFGRRKEMVLRAALGAGRERLVRQLLTECGLLTFVGSAIGVGIAYLAIPLLKDLVPVRLPIADSSTMEPRMLAFTLIITLVTGLGFGLFPALRLGKGDSELLQRHSDNGKQGLRQGLVVAEVALSVSLLATCLLLLAALGQVQGTDPGFTTQDLYTLEIPLSMPGYSATATRNQFYQEVVNEVNALPGVESSAFISFVPMGMTGGVWPVLIPGRELDQTDERASLRYVTPGYLDTMKIPLVTGRDLSPSDTFESQFVAIVSQSFADQYFPGSSVIGQSFEFGLSLRTIVGVAGNVKVRGLERDSEPQVYLPPTQVADGALTFYVPRKLMIRSQVGLEQLLPSIRNIVNRIDPELPIAGARPMSDIVLGDTASRRAQLSVLGSFALLALILAALGIYGLLSFSVAQRRVEVGVRMALGARRSGVTLLFLREAVRLFVLGSSIGVFLSWGAGRWLHSTLAGMDIYNPGVIAIALGIAGLLTTAGAVFPVMKASRIDPIQTLRSQ